MHFNILRTAQAIPFQNLFSTLSTGSPIFLAHPIANIGARNIRMAMIIHSPIQNLALTVSHHLVTFAIYFPITSITGLTTTSFHMVSRPVVKLPHPVPYQFPLVWSDLRFPSKYQ